MSMAKQLKLSLLMGNLLVNSVFAQVSFDAITVDKTTRTQRFDKVYMNNGSNQYKGVKLTLSNGVEVINISTNQSLSSAYTYNLMTEYAIKQAIIAGTNGIGTTLMALIADIQGNTNNYQIAYTNSEAISILLAEIRGNTNKYEIGNTNSLANSILIAGIRDNTNNYQWAYVTIGAIDDLIAYQAGTNVFTATNTFLATLYGGTSYWSLITLQNDKGGRINVGRYSAGYPYSIIQSLATSSGMELRSTNDASILSLYEDYTATFNTAWKVYGGTSDWVQVDLTSFGSLGTQAVRAAQAATTNIIYTGTNTPDFMMASHGYPKLALSTTMVSSSVSAQTPITLNSFVSAFDDDFTSNTSTGLFNADSHTYLIDLGAYYAGFLYINFVTDPAAVTTVGVGYGGDSVVISGGYAYYAAFGRALQTPSFYLDATAPLTTNNFILPFVGNKITFHIAATAVGNVTYYIRDLSIWGVTNGFNNFGGTPW